MLNFNKLFKVFYRIPNKQNFNTFAEAADKPKQIVKKKKLVLIRDGMNLNFQLLKKVDSNNASLFNDGYVFLDLKEANQVWVNKY